MTEAKQDEDFKLPGDKTAANERKGGITMKGGDEEEVEDESDSEESEEEDELTKEAGDYSPWFKVTRGS